MNADYFPYTRCRPMANSPIAMKQITTEFLQNAREGPFSSLNQKFNTMAYVEVSQLTSSGERSISPFLHSSVEMLSWGLAEFLGFLPDGSTSWSLWNKRGIMDMRRTTVSIDRAVCGCASQSTTLRDVLLLTDSPSVRNPTSANFVKFCWQRRKRNVLTFQLTDGKFFSNTQLAIWLTASWRVDVAWLI